MTEKQPITSIIKKLPAVYQQAGGFLDQFLKAFEDVLMGNPGSDGSIGSDLDNTSRASMKSVQYILDNMDKYFDAFYTPPQFLEWLAAWVGYTLKRGAEYNDVNDMIENEYESPIGQYLPLTQERESYNRIFISRMVTLYQKSSTYEGIREFIDFFIEKMAYNMDGESIEIKDIVSVQIDEYAQPFVLGETARISRDTILGEQRPYYFRVIIRINSSNTDLQDRIVEDITRILEEEKPAHTYYVYTKVVPE
jgi:hypothetical protein